MKLITILLILFVPVLNISLNTSAKMTARKADTYLGALHSYHFLATFTISVLIVLCLLALYWTGIELSRAILIMGAISILGGSLFGVLFYQETLSWIEWFIFLNLTGLIIYRFVLSLR